MALSEYEKEVLAQMERGLKEEDPKLASVLTSSLPEPDSAPSSLSPRRVALGSIAAIIGLAVVVIGVSASQLWLSIVLGVVGFVFMVFGVLWALRGEPNPGKPAKTVKSDEGSAGFMDRQRERWENRGRD